MKYLFVDFIRFWAMVSIVYIHSLQASNAAFHMSENMQAYSYFFDLLQLPLKFGTICFYIISGFLLGEKLLVSSPADFFKRRLNNIFKPYIVAVILFVLWNALHFISSANGQPALENYLRNLYPEFLDALSNSSYWFVWNFFIALSIILAFRKYLFTALFPIALAAITLFYSANIYLNLFEPKHTMAVFGFVFYLWLGVFINKNQKVIQEFIQKTSLVIFLLIALVFVCFSQFEAKALYALHAVEPHNTLKISNQLFSISMFFILMKISFIGLPRFVNPRKETFGIYLYHMFFVVLFARMFHYTSLNSLTQEKGITFPLSLFIGYFLFTYIGATLFVKALNQTSLSWLVGNRKKSRLAIIKELKPNLDNPVISKSV